MDLPQVVSVLVLAQSMEVLASRCREVVLRRSRTGGGGQLGQDRRRVRRRMDDKMLFGVAGPTLLAQPERVGHGDDRRPSTNSPRLVVGSLNVASTCATGARPGRREGELTAGSPDPLRMSFCSALSCHSGMPTDIRPGRVAGRN